MLLADTDTVATWYGIISSLIIFPPLIYFAWKAYWAQEAAFDLMEERAEREMAEMEKNLEIVAASDGKSESEVGNPPEKKLTAEELATQLTEHFIKTGQMGGPR